MTTIDFITALFYEVDEQLHAMPKHPEAHLWPGEVVTLGLLHALKGVGNRAFYRWLTRDYRPLFPRLPERTRLFRLLHPSGLDAGFLGRPDRARRHRHLRHRVDPSDARRPGRPHQIGRKGLSDPSLDCRRETLSAAQSVGINRGMGV